MQRPNSAPKEANVPIIDMAALRNIGSEERSRVIEEIREASCRFGFFQVVNHGVSEPVLDEALSVASKFFDLPTEEKMKLLSGDVHKPVRFGTSLKNDGDKVQFWRVFLKHYSNPLNDWIHMWPQNPPDYREKMGRWSEEVMKLGIEVMTTLIEILGINPTNNLTQKIENGMQVVAVNYYPPCPQPELALGLPPHSDYSCLTILHQSSPGLEIMDSEDNTWKLVPFVPGALQVNIGDHFQVLSNGLYKSVLHRAILNNSETRISIASLFSLGLDDKVDPAKELVSAQNPKRYRESSLRDFLNFLANNDFGSEGKNFIDILKLKNN
ncbi:hypothetical protein TanjilG_10830 [Lupinus angustifolius]|uniref:Fe2OG dioxygenase domain-containing protein n=2 Tax=Lupinus angustifolius TaxID=3871 RepID=A0A394DFB0_LUPAN|nr:hypothetical protein TanjilG_10830 [Lupinus angustifolius]